MVSGVSGQIHLIALLHVEMPPSNNFDNATIHLHHLEEKHVQERPHKQLLAHSEIVQLVSV
jgi:hypothetical protein